MQHLTQSKSLNCSSEPTPHFQKHAQRPHSSEVFSFDTLINAKLPITEKYVKSELPYERCVKKHISQKGKSKQEPAMRLRHTFAFASLLLASTTLTTSALATQLPSTPLTVDTKPTHIMLFKNGYGLVSAKADLTNIHNKLNDFSSDAPASITFQTPLFPNAVQGTFWLAWDGNITDIKSLYAKTSKKVVASNIFEVVRSSVGKTVHLKIRESQDQSSWITAKIIEVPQVCNDKCNNSTSHQMLPPRFSQMVYIQNSDTITALNMHQIEQIRFDETDSLPMIDQITPKQMLQFTSVAPNRNTKPESIDFNMSYLAKGIAWTPSYVIDITGMTDSNPKGKISAKSIIVNDLMDMDNVTAELIAGYPHIEYQDAESALTLKPLDQIIRPLMRGFGLAKEKSIRYTNRMPMAEMAMDTGSPSMPSIPVQGEMVEDLYFYKINNISLKKGERGYYPLFAADIPASSIYTWDIPDFLDGYENYRMPNPNEPQTVWHSLELTNTTNMPWTSAPTTTTKEGRILGQDTIQYTPPKGKTRVKITQALQIKAEIQEQEISRKRGSERIDNRVYDLVTMQGTLVITNFKKDDVDIEITKLISGKLINVDKKPETTVAPLGLGRANSQTKIKWTENIKPGQRNKITLRYRYTFLTNGQVSKTSFFQKSR